MVAFVVPAGITGARIAGPYIANLVRQYGPAVAKGIINLINKDDEDKKKTVTIDEEGNVLPDLPDQMPDPDEDPDEPTIIFDDPQTLSRKLVEQEIQNLIDKSIDKLSEKYKEIDEKRKFDLYREDPSVK